MSMETYERSLKEDLKLNRFALDKEAERQADMYLYWSMELAEAKSERDKAKTRLGIISGERELEIRNNPGYDGKITEGVIKALVMSDKTIEEAQNILDLGNKNVNSLEGVVRALDHKKSQIDNLTRLSIAGYYSTPKQDNEAIEARKQLNKKD